MALLKPSLSKVLVPCAAAEDERTLDVCRSLGMEARGLFPTRLYDVHRPAPLGESAYVKRMNPEAVLDAARLFGAEAVFAPRRQPVLEASCRRAGLAYLDPLAFEAS